MPGLAAYLDGRPGVRGQVEDRGKIVGRPGAGVRIPGRPGGNRDRAGQLGALLAGQVRDIRGGERRGEPGEQRDRGQRDREEGQRQPQAERTAAARGARRARGTCRGGRVSHRG